MTDTKDNRPAFDAALDLEAAARTERAYLAAALEDPVRVIPLALRRGVTGADFTGAARGDVFDAVLAVFNDAGAVDAVTVFERLAGNAAARDEIDKCAGQGFPEHAAQYAAEIVKRSQYRRLAEMGLRLNAAASGREEDPAALLSQLSAKVAAMQNATRGEATDAEEVAEIVEHAIAISEGRAKPCGIPPPTPELENALGRLEPGLHLLAAATSAGKSTFEGHFARSVALGGGRVLRCFLDMPRPDLLARDLAALCFVGVEPMTQGSRPLLPDEKHALRLAAEAWRGFGMESMTAPTLGEIVGRARAFHADKGLDLLTIDYAQLVLTGNGKLDGTGNANAQLEHTVAVLKNFANKERIPVLLLSQLKRKPEDEFTPPTLDDLRGSGALGHAGRTVSFLYPAEVAKEWAKKKTNSEEPTAWRKLATRPVLFLPLKAQQRQSGVEVALRMFCPFFTFEDAALNDTGVRLACGDVFWDRPGKVGPNNPLPVIARDGDGRLAAFDRRFLSRINAAAEKKGFPAFEVVEEVAGGVAAVHERLTAWREAARGAGA